MLTPEERARAWLQRNHSRAFPALKSLAALIREAHAAGVAERNAAVVRTLRETSEKAGKRYDETGDWCDSHVANILDMLADGFEHEERKP